MHASAQRVAICMAAYNPEPELFRDQIESIRAQSHSEWTCVISDDASDPDRRAAMEEAVRGDERFRLLESAAARLGFYRNFERALEAADPAAPYVALADHDDRWYPDKLSTLLEAISRTGAQLVYSDARAVEPSGAEVRPTMWSPDERPNQWTDLATMLIANTVTGAASMFRRELLAAALPFPELPGKPYHDHWLAAVALASGELDYVDRPLYDWVRHPESVVVGETALLRPADFGRLDLHPMRALRRGPRAAAGGALAAWEPDERDQLRRLELTAAEISSRLGDRIEPGKRRALRGIEAADSARGALRLAGRWARARVTNGASMGRELLLLRGIGARRLARLRGRPAR